MRAIDSWVKDVTLDETIKATMEELAESLGCSGWVYRNIPWMPSAEFTSMVTKFGDGIKLLTTNKMPRDGVHMTAGQALINPSALKELVG